MLPGVGKNNQQRRAAKAKQRARRGPTPPSEGRPPVGDVFVGWTPDPEQVRRDEAYEVLQTWSWMVAELTGDAVGHQVAEDVAERSPEVLLVVEALLVDELGARLARSYEYGWEPRDLVHAARKNPRSGAYLATLIVLHARANGAAARAPQRWRDQLVDLGLDALPPVVRWRPLATVAGAADQVSAWTDLLRLLKLLAELVPLEPLGPPPSRWGRRTEEATVSDPTTGRDRLLNRIRALLAKAEATDHPAEAETFTAKAQQLMTRHALDEALVRGTRDDEIPVETRRVHLQAPYAGEKAVLLSSVARPNRCRVVLLDRHDIAMLLGTPLDVDQTEMLFTSLLIQATRAMAEAGHRRAGTFDRSATFRRSFLTAYATRIGERLEEADRSTTASYGAELVPLLQREADAVTAEFERQFPYTTTGGSGYLDSRGWAAGRAAADRAALVAGQLPV